MKLVEAYNNIIKFANIPFKEYLSEDVIKDPMMKIAKGRTGQLLEITIGLNLSNTTLDFEDGELKTNKCDKNGKPKETMFITQTASIIDELLVSKEFKSTKLYAKLKHLLYVPISKDGDTSEWMYLTPVEVNLDLPKYYDLAVQLEKDYYDICNQMKEQLSVSTSATLHTVSGKFIQIRTKDSKPYTPIYSNVYEREVSDKNRAFYFKKEFMEYIVALEKVE